MIEVKSYEMFCAKHMLEPNDPVPTTISISIPKNRARYLKYLSYETGRPVSQIVRQFLTISSDELYDVDYDGKCTEDDVYAKVVDHPNPLFIHAIDDLKVE